MKNTIFKFWTVFSSWFVKFFEKLGIVCCKFIIDYIIDDILDYIDYRNGNYDITEDFKNDK